MSISAITDSSVATDSAGKLSQALASQDFLNIMITELTNQDPLEPMSNQDLLNQMSTIQQLDASQNMTTSFNNLMSQFDTFLMRQQLSTASELVGTLVSGTSTDGLPVFGEVTGISMSDDGLALRLDTGELVEFDNIDSLGGRSGENIVGSVIMGLLPDGRTVVGRVESVIVDENQATLILESQTDPDDPDAQITHEIPLSNATTLSKQNVALLIGQTISGFDAEGNFIEGAATQYSLAQDENGNDLVSVVVQYNDPDTNETTTTEILLSNITEIQNTNAL